MMSKAITVVLADDHSATRAGVRLALEPHGFRIVAEATNANDAVAAALRRRPQACLLDIYMPGGGISAAERISTELPETKIVMLTVSAGEDDLFDAIRAGASGYLLKTTAPDRLHLALRGLLSGEAALPRELTARLIEEFRNRSGRRRLPLLGRSVELTARESEVLELLQEGLSTVQIARRLNISDVTVRRHISALVKKLGTSDRKSALKLLRDEERRPDSDPSKQPS